jgi:hypothetical protein
MVYILMKENTFNFFSDDYAQSRMTYDTYSKQINDILAAGQWFYPGSRVESGIKYHNSNPNPVYNL